MTSLRKYQREMLQEAKLGMAPLHLLNDRALFYPVSLAQFLIDDDKENAGTPYLGLSAAINSALSACQLRLADPTVSTPPLRLIQFQCTSA